MSLDCVHFASPTDINVELALTGEFLLIRLHFPGIGKSPSPLPQHMRGGSSLFSCFFSSKKRTLTQGSTWMKLIDEKTPSTVMRSGEWVPIQPEKKPVNGEIWLRIFRRRISIMSIPPKQEKNAMQVNLKTSVPVGPPITRYYYWDSGRLNKALNPRKSEILVNHDQISLRLACSGELWTEEDVRELKKVPQNKEAEMKSKVAPEVQIKHEPVSEGTAFLGTSSQEGNQTDCPGGDANSCKNNAASVPPTAEERQLEGEEERIKAVEKIEKMEENPKLNREERKKAVVSERTSCLDTETHPLERPELDDAAQKWVSRETVSIKAEPDENFRELQGSRTMIEGKAEDEREGRMQKAEDPKRIERATSCTDLCKVVDAATATATTTEGGKKCGDGNDGVHCHYCLGVREQVGKAEFCALQARVEAMDKEEWGRVLDIIIGKSGAKDYPMERPQCVVSRHLMGQESRASVTADWTLEAQANTILVYIKRSIQISFHTMSSYRIHFDYPTKVETARMNNKARSLFVRLTFPGLHKPSPERRRSKGCRGCRCSCTSAPSSQDDHEPVWSNLTKPPAKSSSKSAVPNSPSNWTSVQPSQKPANGDIWIRVASNRVSLMLILCGPSPLTQRVDSRASEAQQESLKSLSISDLRDQEEETYSDHFPTLYYYWDSGRLSRKLDPVKSSMAVAETCVCLMLAAAARGEGWSDEDLKMVHKSVRVSTPPIPRKRTVEKRDFCWQESVKDTEEVSSKNFVIVDCENGTELPSKSPEIGDVESNECGEGEEDRPPRLVNRIASNSARTCQCKSNCDRTRHLDSWVDESVVEMPDETAEKCTPVKPMPHKAGSLGTINGTRQRANMRKAVRRQRHEMLMQIFASSQPSTRSSISSNGCDALDQDQIGLARKTVQLSGVA
ncbi:unnamed protein product [Taenia asiatica]|uniref:PHD-type domain-containing protein n=1 Tax=Taenia asiatica TaxID=60517 RepID=A0A0R3W1C0_TAEAS|nr:unnamed protein product [Taenia asiatica]